MNDNKNKTLVVNLYGAPGAGKSSGAAYIFYKLKKAGINCELVTEFAKDKVWEGSKAVFEDGCYIFGKQHFRMNRLMGKVEVIITDSPLMISAYYGKEFKDELTSMAKRSFNDNQISVFVNRVKKYNPKGRFQTEEESDVVAGELKEFLLANNVNFISINGDEKGYNSIVDMVIHQLEEPENKAVKGEPLTEKVAKKIITLVENYKTRGYGESTYCMGHTFVTNISPVYIEDGWLIINSYSIKIGKKDAYVNFFKEGFSIDMGAHDGNVKHFQCNHEKGVWEWVTQWSFTLWNGRSTFKTFSINKKEQIERLQGDYKSIYVYNDELGKKATLCHYTSTSVIGDDFYFLNGGKKEFSINLKDIESSIILDNGNLVVLMTDGRELYLW